MSVDEMCAERTSDIEDIFVEDLADIAPKPAYRRSTEPYSLWFAREINGANIDFNRVDLLEPDEPINPARLTADTVLLARKRAPKRRDYEIILNYRFVGDDYDQSETDHDFLAQITSERPALKRKNGKEVFLALLRHQLGHLVSGHLDNPLIQSDGIAGRIYHFFADLRAERFAAERAAETKAQIYDFSN